MQQNTIVSRSRLKRIRSFVVVGVLCCFILLVLGLVWWDYNKHEGPGGVQDLMENSHSLSTKEREEYDRIGELMYIYPDSARILAHERLKAIDSSLKKGYEMLYNYIIGSTYIFQSDYPKALVAYHRSLDLALEYNSPILVSFALNNIGAVNVYVGNYRDALFFLLQALEVKDGLQLNKKEIANSQNNIGAIYFEINDFSMAKLYFQKAYNGFMEGNDSIGLSSVTNNLAQYYEKIGMPDSALYFFHESLQLTMKTNNNVVLTSTYQNMGNFYLSQDDYQQALTFYMESDSISRVIDSKSNLLGSQLGLGKVYQAMQLPNRALQNAYGALSLAKELNNTNETYEAYRLLASLFEMKNEHVKALAYANEADEIVRKQKEEANYVSVYNEEIRRLSESMAMKDQKIKMGKLISDRQKAVSLVIILLLTFIVIVVSLIYYLYLNKIRQKQKERELQNSITHAQEKAQAVMNAEIFERQRLSAELHDGIGPLLSLSKVNANNVLEREGMEGQKRARMLQTTVNNIEEALREIKNISDNMSSQILVEKGFVEALKDLSLRLSHLRDFDLELNINGVNGEYKPYVEHSLYRILQEVLNNVVKHAQCTELNIQLLQDKEELTVMIEDNGKGFDPSMLTDHQGKGLKNAQYRMDSIGGKIHFDSMPGRGTIVTLIVPAEVLL